MKKSRFWALIILTVSLLFALSLSAFALCGDVDGNGEVTVSDARQALRFAVGLDIPTDTQTDLADIDRDGYVGTEDARAILRAGAGIQSLPVHDYSPWVTQKAPTCTEGGYATCSCSICGETKTKILKPLGHKATQATCTEPSVCTVCGEILAPPLGHTTRCGVCERCGKYINDGFTMQLSSGKDLCIGDSLATLKIYLGEPTENFTDETPNGELNIYVYASDYTRLCIFFLQNDSTVAMYTNDSNAVFTDGTDSFHVNEKSDATHIGQIEFTQYRDILGGDENIYYSALAYQKDFSYNMENVGNLQIPEKLLFYLSNGCRALNNKPALIYSEKIADVARAHSVDMADNNYFDHVDSGGLRANSRLTNAGIPYSCWGENIYCGNGSEADVFFIINGWYNSSSHRPNLLSKQYNFRYLGIGFAYNPDSTYKYYCTQNFTG